MTGFDASLTSLSNDLMRISHTHCLCYQAECKLLLRESQMCDVVVCYLLLPMLLVKAYMRLSLM